VFGHDRLTDLAVFLNDPHVEYVNETDRRTGIRVDVHALRAPRLIRLIPFSTRLIFLDLEEIERNAIVAGHRKDGSSVTLHR
jgi:hypothetical protein